MILTFTPNPSIDATLDLPEQLERGAVQRLSNYAQVAGGKGINVSHAIHKAQLATKALFPASPQDPFLELLRKTDIPFDAITIAGDIRTNTTITEPNGTTTKLNSPGFAANNEFLNAATDALLKAAQSASWVVLAGSLPHGAPADWYAQLIKLLRTELPSLKIAVDTSDDPLLALGTATQPSCAPDVIKPNGVELGQLVGVDGNELEQAAMNGDFDAIIDAAQQLVHAGISNVLVTLGGAGAVLVTAQEIWRATPPPTKVLSTVGAGDSTLAGFVMAHEQGLSTQEALQQGVAYGSAAAGLPGTTIPTPAQIDIANTRVWQCSS